MIALQPSYWVSACAALAAADPVMAALINQYPGLTLTSKGDAFGTLARSIVGQQISIKAADSVWARLERLLGQVCSDMLLAQSVESLRSCGLSARKVEYLTDLARHQQLGRLEPSLWLDWPDDAIIAELVSIRGIGRWSAEMFLIFYLLRPNVLPMDDIGLQKAVAKHYQQGERPSRAQIHTLATLWQPWCTVATWYLWRSLDPVPVEY